MRRSLGRPSAGAAGALLAAYLLLPAVLALGPLPVGLLDRTTSVVNQTMVWLGLDPTSVNRLDVEEVGNVLLFIPVGALVSLTLVRLAAARVLFLCLAGSTAIEAAQWLLLSSRYPSAYDVLLNTSGAAIGITLARSRKLEWDSGAQGGG